VQCRPYCQFIHPSDPDWDRAPPATIRGRGGPPYGSRGRGQTSGVLSSGANSIPKSSERANSSSTWDDYIAGFGSSARGTPSLRSSRTAMAPSGLGDRGASGSGWGSSTNNNVGASDGWQSGPAAPGGDASSSLWGSAGNDLGPGWGQGSNSDQGSKAPSVAAFPSAASPPGPDARSGGGWDTNNPDAATPTTPSSQTIPSVITSSQLNTIHSEQCGDNVPVPAMVNPPLLACEASSAASLEQSSSINPINEPQTRSAPDGNDGHVVPNLLDLLGNEMRFVGVLMCYTEDVLSPLSTAK
jgi:hypothetical protein